MTKQQKLNAIYEAMADKTLSDGCIVLWKEIIEWNPHNLGKEHRTIYHRVLWTYSLWTDFVSYRHIYRLKKIIWHPVRIGDVLDYDESIRYSIDDAESDEILFLWENKRLSIDEQSESCIDYVYSLIQK